MHSRSKVIDTAERPSFIITIDTEGDNLWQCTSGKTTTENAYFLSRFQNLCESYQLKPTYLANYEMSECQAFVDFGRDVIQRGVAEIGMHLHAWNNPPIVSLTGNDDLYQPYLIEYPAEVIREKIKIMTHRLEDTFQVKMLSHRAGRWSFNAEYASYLIDEGYLVDCSVTPYVSWQLSLGDPLQTGGVDFRAYPDCPYYVALSDIRLPGNSDLLEVPMTIIPKRLGIFLRYISPRMLSKRYLGRILKTLAPLHWLRPNGSNLNGLLWILKRAQEEQRSYVQFMLHSSELMPGGSPTFPTKKSIETLYKHLNILFKSSLSHFTGMTLSEYANGYRHKIG